MTKTIALFIDSYRELNARRLFWIALVINVVAVMFCGALGIKDGTLTLFAWKTPIDPDFLRFINPAEFYKGLFTYFGVSIWLTWAATILALVSTTSIFPDFLAGGSIDIYLSKPISRLWLFIMKYLGGMIFVALQVTVFAIGGFLVLGLRANDWEPTVFLAIPLVVSVFSFLYCFCVLLGVITRSAIASLLITLLIWLGLFGTQTAESLLLEAATVHQLKIHTLERQLGQVTDVAPRSHRSNRFDLTHPRSYASMMPFGIGQESKAQMERELADLKADKTIERYHEIALVSVTVLPKTEVAVDLLRKVLLKDESKVVDDQSNASPDFQDDLQMRHMSPDQRDYLQHEILKAKDSRSVAWSLGTSFLSEILIVGIAAGLFVRRDF
jgi:ABC-type transport system involved in multi-copper enzyme maturation permease subunit